MRVFLFRRWRALGGDASVSQTATYTKFKQYVEKGYAKSVEVIKQDGVARMYVKPQNVRDVFGKTQQQTGKKPYVKTQYGSLDELTTYLDSAQQRGKVTDVSFDNTKGNFLPTCCGSLARWPAHLLLDFLDATHERRWRWRWRVQHRQEQSQDV